MQSPLVKSKFNYFGSIDNLPFILNKIKSMNEKSVMISENNMILEIIFKYNLDYDETFKNSHIDMMIEDLKKINLQGNVSLRKTYGNIYIF